MPVMRLGIFLPNWIGDVVMATPALRAIRRHFGPETQIVGIMRPYVSGVLEGTDWFDGQLLYDKVAKEPELRRETLVKNLREQRLDQILLMPNSIRTAWMAWRSGARQRIGYGGQFRGWMLTRRLAPAIDRQTGRPLATIDSYLNMAVALGCPPEAPRMELATTEEDERRADAAWKALKLPDGKDVVVMNSGGAFGAAKNWPIEHFVALAQRIASDWDHHVLINSGPCERTFAKEVVARAGDARIVTLADIEELPIGLTKAAIRRARLVVSTDSGPRFFGIAFEKPVVTLFGPTDPLATATYYERETCLSLGLDCQPCMERTCPLKHHRCMRDLTVDRVYAAVAFHLRAPSRAAGAA